MASASLVALSPQRAGAQALPPLGVLAREAVQPAPRGWVWPLEPRPAVVRPFDPPSRPWLSGHRGVDLAAPNGAEVRSPAAGTVVFSGWVVDRPVVTVDHGEGRRSSFEPVSGSVPVGTRVDRGAGLGTVTVSEAGHCAPSTCLHWGVREGGAGSDDYRDPIAFIEDRRPSVLLPWNGG
ncbi:M23 family metallopeptidase [Sinomonas sp. JC656]|uniref:M23 family metallopeptidase n=2 Tax=Sinomonas cellulolyticus TaxID=2801916 RepID=A0ABS1JYB6_9MICC|nr:M23 family metallopeptidase [Sinomonas cellulolyticus]